MSAAPSSREAGGSAWRLRQSLQRTLSLVEELEGGLDQAEVDHLPHKGVISAAALLASHGVGDGWEPLTTCGKLFHLANGVPLTVLVMQEAVQQEGCTIAGDDHHVQELAFTALMR
jgi:hypothetical protein